jgi:hypothetical protein
MDLQKDNERLQATIDSFDTVLENWQGLYNQSRQETLLVSGYVVELQRDLQKHFTAILILVPFCLILGFVLGYLLT